MRIIILLLLSALLGNGATFYLRSTDGSDADDGSTWALAKATLANALSVMAAGDTLYVSQVHGEITNGTLALTFTGTAAAPSRVLCANDGAEPPTALATSAIVANSGSSAITFAGFGYVYGMNFRSTSNSSSSQIIGFNSANPSWFKMEQCALENHSTQAGSGANVTFGAAGSGNKDFYVELDGCSLRLGAIAQTIAIRSSVRMVNMTNLFSSGVKPTTIFTPSTDAFGSLYVVGCDFSSFGANSNIISVSPAVSYRATFIDCKMGAAAFTTGSGAGQGGVETTFINCDSADTNYRYHRQTYQGTENQETTIVRTSGASDGTTSFSRKMVTTANSKFFSPMESQPIDYWNETVGSSVTVTVPVITDNVTLTDAEAWVEVQYLGTSGFPFGNFASDRATDILATPANQTTDGSSTWTTTGLVTPVKQSLSVTVTPQEKGIIRARVMLAKASTTMYYDPKILATSGRQYMATDGVANEGATGGGGGTETRILRR